MNLDKQLLLIKSDLDMFTTVDDKMQYILELAEIFSGIHESEKTEANLLKGCASTAWLIKEYDGTIITFRADGESAIAKGMLSLMLDIYSGHTPEEILAFDPHRLGELGLHALLSPVRQKSLETLIGEIYGYARLCHDTNINAS